MSKPLWPVPRAPECLAGLLLPHHSYFWAQHCGPCFGRSRLSAWQTEPNGRARMRVYGDGRTLRHGEKTVSLCCLSAHLGGYIMGSGLCGPGVHVWNLRPYCPTVFLLITCWPDHQTVLVCGLAGAWSDRGHLSGSPCSGLVIQSSGQIDGETQEGPRFTDLPPGTHH